MKQISQIVKVNKQSLQIKRKLCLSDEQNYVKNYIYIDFIYNFI